MANYDPPLTIGSSTEYTQRRSNTGDQGFFYMVLFLFVGLAFVVGLYLIAGDANSESDRQESRDITQSFNKQQFVRIQHARITNPFSDHKYQLPENTEGFTCFDASDCRCTSGNQPFCNEYCFCECSNQKQSDKCVAKCQFDKECKNCSKHISRSCGANCNCGCETNFRAKRLCFPCETHKDCLKCDSGFHSVCTENCSCSCLKEKRPDACPKRCRSKEECGGCPNNEFVTCDDRCRCRCGRLNVNDKCEKSCKKGHDCPQCSAGQHAHCDGKCICSCSKEKQRDICIFSRMDDDGVVY